MKNSAKKSFNQQSFVEIEHEVLNFWAKHDIFQKIQKQHENDPPYWYYDGPPFATGLPHHGHLLASTIKDIIPRYFEMNGHNVPRHFGWDCHGVPIEHAIDKDLGLSTEEALAKLGLAGYNQACAGIVDKYAEQWEHTIKRMGRWVDFTKAYKTLDSNYMESVWWAIAELYKKDLIYQGVKVVPYSTNLRTPLSNFEASSNYQRIQNPAITVLAKLRDEDTFLAIWTTTPWTLPTNLAICIGYHRYIKVKDKKNNRHIIIAKDCLAHLANADSLEVIEDVEADSLVGKQYEPFFPDFANLRSQGAFRVLQDNYVTTSDGTGLVHCAPAHGEDDYRVCQNANIPVVCAIDEAGCFNSDIIDFAGLAIKDANKKIIHQLKDRELLYHQDVIVHNYPFCPRTDTPLIYKTIPSWYVRVTKIKEKLLHANQSIHWVPEHIKQGRFGKWLDNAKDWAISRNRYWGTPIPLWVNDQNANVICIGSKEELLQYSGKEPTDLHREHIDNITFVLPNEDGVYRRIPEVLDCWFESGSMPFAQLHYPFENKALFHDLFPATFIAEGIDQTRGWFYTLTVLASALFDKPAFKNVIVNGIVMAEDGKKMSKRLKNYTPPNKLLETYGADALRLYLIQSNLVKAEEQRFSDEGVKDITRRILLPWKNAFSFFITYAEADQWQPQQTKPEYENILDRWILGRLEQLTIQINSAMQEYKLHSITQHIESFLDDLTNTYIRLNRDRFWTEGIDKDKDLAFSCLDKVTYTLSTLMAPFTPFLSEKIHSERIKILSRTENETSIHALAYPTSCSQVLDKKLTIGVRTMQQILLLGRQGRNDAKIKTKIPLATITIAHSQQAVLASIKPLEDYILKELNIKSIQYTVNEESLIRLKAKVNLPKLGRVLGKKLQAVRHEVESLDDEAIRNFENSAKYRCKSIDIDLDKEDIIIEREALAGSHALSNKVITIALDTTLNDALLAEGTAREVINRIQKIRKEMDLNVSDRILIKVTCSDPLKKIIQMHCKHIQQETLSIELQFSQKPLLHTINIDEHEATIEIEKIK